ncbi:AraC family transcriptional regulator [Paenibacillus ferrarius]|uniref:AraC family transcriptional regulator n=1 Tax=Paenibacillus ferrarius TaxID=1469647 RepID=UPI003D2D5D28
MQRPNWKSTPFFTRMLVFNLMLILVLGIIPLVVLFQYVMSAYNQELKNFNFQAVKQIRSTIDEQFLKPTVQIANRNLTETTSGEPPLFYPMTHNIRNEYSSLTNIGTILSSIEGELTFANSVDMYYRNNNVFFYGTKFFCFLSESDCNLGFRSAWLKEFQQTETQIGWYTIDAEDNEDHEKLISYVRSYPYFATMENRKAVFAINLKESAIRKKLTQSLDQVKGLTFILDDQGHLVSSNGSREEEQAFLALREHWTQLTEEQPILNTEWNGTEAVAALTKSEINKWRYVTIVEKSVFYKRATDLRNFMYVLGGALLAIGILLVYMLTKKAHQPIGHALMAYSMQIHDLHDQLSKNEPVIKYHYIMNLLTGTGEPDLERPVSDMQKFLDVQLLEEHFVCFNVKPMDGLDGNSRHDVVAAYRIIERLEQPHDPTYRIWAIVSEDRQIYGIVNGSVIAAERLEQMLLEQIRQATDQPYCLCMGSAYKVAETPLSVSHREACEAAKYAYFYPDRAVLRYAELQTASRKANDGTVKALDDLADALRTGDQTKAQQTLQAVLQDTLSDTYNEEYGQNLLTELVFTIRKTLKSMGISLSELYGYDIRDHAKSFPNIKLFSAWLDDVVRTALQYMEERRRSPDQELDIRVKSFIEEHLFGELSLDIVAEHIGVTPNYLSRLFKQSAGVTFIEYVTKRKLEAAAKLLVENNHSVNEIAAMLGYQSTNHFIRIFKEKYGQTPKQYQKLEA